MGLLGIMEIRRKIDGEVSGFEYSFFFDYVIKGYSGQDHVQVSVVTQLAVDTIQEHHYETNRLSFSQIMQVVLPHNN